MNLLASSGQLRASFMRWALVCVPVIVLLGFLSGKAAQSGPENPWFAALVKPAFYPPAATFGIVWTVLYVMMGLALAIVLSARGARGREAAVIVFLVQLVLNLAWSPVFFGAHMLTGGLIVIGLLDLAVLITVLLFWKVRPTAAMLLLPYLVWIVFATYLNYAFLQANPTMDGVEGGGAVVRYEI
ncbi:TspO/MBR family protein [Novosphingobium mangrovi (ex Huang et al. 2023)]|uniref:Tryptophan-rich sensory protein n=1 Tax=Novosphingobium mangrovi (ex Huang et al. 2023) TaxID=2976432 RepID=A0ABT2IA47_9SPHN|nr:TspO/MBR family protein [Novosphingobium mangrovi (ex Huang et al. 2023)]MCT2401700.1 tryptophan-rich sensory protein [Novosphingobium mangrovi (ex Huang et al. 2023)]